MTDTAILILAASAVPLIYAVALLMYVSQAAHWARRTHEQAEFQSRCLKLLLERDAQR